MFLIPASSILLFESFGSFGLILLSFSIAETSSWMVCSLFYSFLSFKLWSNLSFRLLDVTIVSILLTNSPIKSGEDSLSIWVILLLSRSVIFIGEVSRTNLSSWGKFVSLTAASMLSVSGALLCSTTLATFDY